MEIPILSTNNTEWNLNIMNIVRLLSLLRENAHLETELSKYVLGFTGGLQEYVVLLGTIAIMIFE